MSKKTIKDRLKKECACCGKGINVILYSDRSYRGGHYFGKIPSAPNYSEKKSDPKYWECPKCYW